MEDQQLGKDFFVKDYHFYKGNENTWNRPSWSSKKQFLFYHRDAILKNQDLKGKLDGMISEKKQLELAADTRKVQQTRQALFRQLMGRKIERLVVQNKCRQAIETHPSEFALSKIERLRPEQVSQHVLNRSGIRSHLKSSNSNAWDDFTKLSRKGVELFMTKNFVQNDEFAATSITNKIRGEQNMKTERDFRSQILHDEIYQHEKFLKQRNSSRYSHSNRGSKAATVRSQANFFQQHKSHLDLPENNAARTAETFDRVSVAEAESEKFNLTGKTQSMAKTMSLASKTQRARDAAGGAPNTEDYIEYRGLHVPSFNKDLASLKIPYTEYMLQKSALAKERVQQDLDLVALQPDFDKHKDIRLNRKVQSHLPVVKQVAKKADPEELQLDKKENILRELDDFDTYLRVKGVRDEEAEGTLLFQRERPARKQAPNKLRASQSIPASLGVSLT